MKALLDVPEQLAVPLDPPAPQTPVNRRLPNRDIWLLPLLSVLTVLTMFASAEVVARQLWPEQLDDSCQTEVTEHSRHFLTNCRSMVKVPESPWVHNEYNACGYRSRDACSTKPPGATRVAVLGSSASYGYMNAYEDVYTTRLANQLSDRCKRRVEFQDLGYPDNSMLNLYQEENEALALKPDLILVVVSPIDIRHEIDAEALEHRDDPPSLSSQKKVEVQLSWLYKNVIAPISKSRAVYMLQDVVYQDPRTYLGLYLLHGDDAGFMKYPFSPSWQKRIANTDMLMQGMVSKARAASVPMALVVVPYTTDAALLSTPPRQGLSPNAFQNAMSEVASHSNIPVIDTVPDFGGRPNAMKLFYVVDGHMQKDGEKLLADSLLNRLLTAAPSVFQGCSLKE